MTPGKNSPGTWTRANPADTSPEGTKSGKVSKPRRKRAAHSVPPSPGQSQPGRAMVDTALEHFNLIIRRLDGIDSNVSTLAGRVGAVEAENSPDGGLDLKPNFRQTPERHTASPATQTRARARVTQLMDVDQCSQTCEGHSRAAKSGYTKTSHDCIVRPAPWPHTMVHRLGPQPLRMTH